MGTEALTEPLRETLSQFDASGEPRTTTEVAEALDLGRRSTYNRLERLVEHGRIETKKVGANARVWWRPPAAAGGTDPDWPATAKSLVDDVLDDVEVGIFVLDENYEVAWTNGTIERYFGLGREQAIGRDKRRLVDERIAAAVDDSEAFAETVLATYDDNTDTERFECRVRPGEGREERWLEHRSEPIESGAYAGGRVELYYDVTDRKRAQVARREDREELETVINAVEEYAIFRLDDDGYVRTWNTGAERIKGYDEDEILGEHVSTFYTEADREADTVEENLTAAAEEGSIEREGWRVRADGTRFWANVTVTAVRDDDGTLQGYVKVARDMTERRRAEAERELLYETTRSIAEAETFEDGLRAALGDVCETTDWEYAEAWMPTEDGELRRAEVDYRVDDMAEFAGLSEGYAFESGEGLPGRVYASGEVEWAADLAAEAEGPFLRLDEGLDDVFDRIDDAFYALDDQMRFEYVNERAEELLGHTKHELLDRVVWDALDVAPDDPIRDRFDAAMASQEPMSFERFSEPLDIWETVRLYPSETGLSVYFTEITERKEYERELEEYRRWTQTLVDNFPSGAIALVDEEMRYVTFGGRPEGDTDLARADLEGELVQNALPDQISEVVVPSYEAALNGEASEFEAEIDGRVYQFHFVPVRDDHGDVFAATAMSQDVTERKERERLLREAKSQLEAATEAGAVGTWEWHVQEDRFVAGLSMAQTFGVDSEAAREGISIDRYLSAIHEEDRERVERAIDEALADCGEYEQEYRVRDADGDLRWVVARGRVECDEAGDPVTFPGAIVDITDRKRAERALERRRGQLAALNGLNEVVRDITGAVIEQSTRKEIERTVCERLAATESYLFAWTGEVDPSSQTVRLQAEAGVEGYLDDVTISVDPDDARSEGPTGRALRTGETQVTHDIRVDSRHDPWRSHIEEYEIRSSAAIPITHEGTTYGVLNVYAGRPYAFEGQEREVIDQLGAVVGHAIAAAERKQALLSEELIEIDYQIRDVFGAVDAPVETNGTITIDELVPVEDDEFLVYGTTTTDAVDTLNGLVEVLPHWREVTVHSDSDPANFELRLVDPPVLSVIASHGGYVDEVVFEDGDYRMTIHLAPGTDVRRVTDAVGDAYPKAEMIRRRQITRSHDETRQVRRSIATSLTDRQRTALEAAYYAGFFEWPRETTGEDVAESLGLAPPTFHNHLRKAQRKVLDALLSTPIPSAG